MAVATSVANSGANWEVEVKFHCGDFGPLREKLKQMGGEFLGIGDEEDTYFRHPSRDFAQTGEALRIRTPIHSLSQNSGGNNITAEAPQMGSSANSPSPNGRSILCYKGPKLSGPAKVRREIETDVLGKEMGPLLEALGFLPLLTISKTRESWKLGMDGKICVVCLDEAHGLGKFVEVEVVAKIEERDEAQARVLDLAGQLGLGAKEDRSYLRMQLEKCR
jgi:adenylate cyclase class 2